MDKEPDSVAVGCHGPGKLAREEMTVGSQNSCLVAAAAEIQEMVRRTTFLLLVWQARQKRTGVSVWGMFELVRMAAMRVAALSRLFGGGY